MNLDQCKDRLNGIWPTSQREQARIDAEQWLILEVESLRAQVIAQQAVIEQMSVRVSLMKAGNAGLNNELNDRDSFIATQAKEIEVLKTTPAHNLTRRKR